ncbi:MAG: LysM peptidoglycan-binding domain-containing protein [Clostridia bacterium]
MVTITLGSVKLDVNQTALNISKNSTPKIYTLANGNELIIPCSDKLDIIEFSGFFYEFSNYFAILSMIENAEIVNFCITGLNIPVNYDVIIEKFNTVERGGDVGCVEYSISLKEYVNHTVTILASGVNSSQNTSDIPETLGIPNVYVVQKGDTLWAICKRFLGDPYRYPEIAELNNIKNANLIYPGQEIRFS